MKLHCLLGAAVTALAIPTALAAAAPATAVSVNVSATSTLKSSGKNSYEPWHSLAGQRTQFWCEGKPDEGVGEALIIEFGKPTRVDKVTIGGGVWKSPALFKANNIVTGVDVITDDGRTQSVALPETMDEATASIGGAPI